MSEYSGAVRGAMTRLGSWQRLVDAQGRVGSAVFQNIFLFPPVSSELGLQSRELNTTVGPCLVGWRKILGIFFFY